MRTYLGFGHRVGQWLQRARFSVRASWDGANSRVAHSCHRKQFKRIVSLLANALEVSANKATRKNKPRLRFFMRGGSICCYCGNTIMRAPERSQFRQTDGNKTPIAYLTWNFGNRRFVADRKKIFTFRETVPSPACGGRTGWGRSRCLPPPSPSGPLPTSCLLRS